ncbi:MAG: PKD domain-containing protein [Verrucomicrobiia bacterium]
MKTNDATGRVATLVLVAGTMLWFAPGLQANERHDPANPRFPQLALRGISNGEEAIRRLAQHLPDVALTYGHTPDELRGKLRSDHTLHVDETGRLLYLEDPEPGMEPDQALAADGAAALAESVPLSETFLLHSRPGAKRVIYLDFDGHVLTGTAWNSGLPSTINCPAWSLDSDLGSFNDSERTIIQNIWRRVAEDYLPFDVDVTTEYPGEAAITRSSTSDDLFGMRVLISPISSYFGNYGGIAYVGVFDYVGDYYKPALIFPEKLANNEKYIGEAASHETGHTLGLSHDGTSTVGYYTGSGSGETGWAPIMGVGYYQNLTQWSKGEYTDANNKEDDLVVIQQNGVAYRSDDFGNTFSTAASFPVANYVTAFGMIERNTDVDMFSFTTGTGPISIDVLPAVKGANLDIEATLYDSGGVKIVSSNPTGYLAAGIDADLAAGTYFLSVRGTGQGDPSTGYSSYASLGAYTIDATLVNLSGPAAPVAIIDAAPLSGTGPLLVQFNGSASYDPDASLVGYAWNFGDGTSASGAVASHTYAAAGSYTATLTVTDSSGLTGTASVTVTVLAPNNAPAAVISTAAVQGNAPFAVSFDASGSSDPDGDALSFQWNFGDGTSASGPTATHTYQTAGNYVAKLTVTDARGASSSDTVSITVLPDPSKVIRVAGIVITTATNPAGTVATATVTISDTSGNRISRASVTGTWSDGVTVSGTTDKSGQVKLPSKRIKNPGAWIFTVTKVVKADYAYDPSKNVITKASLP